MSKNISVNEPAHAITAIDHHALVKPYFGSRQRFLSVYYGSNNQNSSVENPTKDRLAIVSNHFIDMQYGNGTATSINESAATIATNPKHQLVSYNKWVMNTNFKNIGSSINEPCSVITANRKWHYLMNPRKLVKLDVYKLSLKRFCMGFCK